MRISYKLPIGLMVMALFAVTATSIAGLFIAGETSKSEIQNKLVAISAGKTNEISQFLIGIDKDLQALADSDRVKGAIENFAYEFSIEGERAKPTLQKRYITENTNPADQRHLLVNPDVDVYDNLHGDYHPHLSKIAEDYGYRDILLVDELDNVVYSVFKNEDFAINLKKDGWENSILAEAVKLTMDESSSDGTAFIDFINYKALDGKPTNILARPVYRNDTRIGTIILRFPYERFQSILSAREGLGVTGETVLINANKQLVSDSIHTSSDDRLVTKISSPMIDKALAGTPVVGDLPNYLGFNTVAALTPVSFHGKNWVMVTSVDQAEAFAPLNTMRNWMLGLALMVLAVGAIAGLLFSRSLVGPIKAVIADISVLAGGNPDFDLAMVERKDEVGDIARALKVFQDGMLERRKLYKEREREAEARVQREKAIDTLIDGFREESNDVIQMMTGNSNNMKERSEFLTVSADESLNNVSDCKEQSQQMFANVQNVATAAEELSSSISEIQRRVEQSGEVINAATTDIENANTEIAALDESASKIGSVISLITDIAEQTNLLALNATIEAARAGDAGKGFAVVASEVKSLASQTAKATEEISRQILNIQNSTKGSVDKIQKISSTMTSIQEYTSYVQSAVSQQGEATNEISNNIAMAADGTKAVVETIANVNDRVESTKQASDVVFGAANDVVTQSSDLRQSINGFLQKVANAKS